MDVLDAIVPAGGSLDEAFASAVGVKHKPLIRFDGKTVLERTVEAVKTAYPGGRIVVVGPESVRQHIAEQVSMALPEADSGPANILLGLDWLRRTTDVPLGKVLVVTSDLPFLTPDSLQRLVSRCDPDAAFSVPLIRNDTFERAYPGAPATFVPVREGLVTTGCAYLIDAQALERAQPHMEAIFERRKSKLAMARLLGPAFVWKLLTKTLTVEDVERKASQILGCTAKAVRDAAAELAFDLDYLDDFRYAERLVQGQP